MIEYRITADDTSDDASEQDRIFRAMHVDDLCAAVWDLQQELRGAVKHSRDNTQAYWAEQWQTRLSELLEITGAQAAMDHYT